MAEEDSLSVPPLPTQKVELSLNEDLGVTFDGNNRPFIVKAVEPGGQGARAMVEVGSKLLRIDGQEVMFMSSTLKRLQFLKKDAVEFEFEREDKESKRRAEEQAHKDKQLFEAAKDGDVNGDILPLLLAGAKPDGHRATGGHGSTALLEASGANRVEAVKALLSHGADVDLRNSFGESGLILASSRGFGGVVAALLRWNAGLEFRDESGSTALVNACGGGHDAVAEALLNAGADAAATTRVGATGLIKASERGRVACVELLLKWKQPGESTDSSGGSGGGGGGGSGGSGVAAVDVNAQTTNGNAALHMASLGGHLTVVEVLLAHGAEVDIRGSGGATGLMLASGRGHVAVVEALLRAGANRKLKSAKGQTALALAKQFNQHDARRLLQSPASCSIS
jgi:ankyrin repeat protein